MKNQVFIFGYYGWKNTGDDAMLYVLLRELNIMYPKRMFVVLSKNALFLPPKIGISVKIIGNTPLSLLREMMHSSIFIVGGGTHFHDHGIRMRAITNGMKIFVLFLIAKIFCKKIYFIGIGVESPTSMLGSLLAKQTCRLADFISVRDSLSYRILKKMDLKNKSILSFDLATLLCPIINDKNLSNPKGNIKILGVSILPYFEIYHNDKEKDLQFVYEISKGINNWLRADPRSIIHLFTFKGKSRDQHVDITGLLQTKIHHKDRVRIMPYNPDPTMTLHLVSQCDAFLGMRYHSCVFAYLTNTPLLIINYFQKCQSLAEDIGLSENAVVSPEEILDGKFWMFLKRLQDRPEDFTARLPVDSARELARDNFELDQCGGF